VEIKTIAEIDLLKNTVYVVKDDRLQEVDKPCHAKLEMDIRF